MAKIVQLEKQLSANIDELTSLKVSFCSKLSETHLQLILIVRWFLVNVLLH